MIEEVKNRAPINTRVKVKELNALGHIYERGVDCVGSGRTVYGVRLDEVAWPKNFVATEVWHCEREDLEVLKDEQEDSYKI